MSSLARRRTTSAHAYQERLDDVQAERTREMAGKRPDDAVIARGREEEARLRSAWGVLSDPYQRGRYDESVWRPDTEEPTTPTTTTSRHRRRGSNGSELSARRTTLRARCESRPPGMFSTRAPAVPASAAGRAAAPPSGTRSWRCSRHHGAHGLILLVIAGARVGQAAYPKQTQATRLMSPNL